MFGQDRNELRQMFFTVWQKLQAGTPLTALEGMVGDVIEAHPEYHAVLKNPDANLDKDYSPDGGQANPFLHMAMHIAVREQVSTDRPRGIAKAFQNLAHRYGDPHAAEHDIHECLGEALWHSQRNGQPPDEAAYLRCIQERVKRGR